MTIRNRLKWIILVLLIVVGGFMAWTLFFPHTFQVGPVSLGTAQSRCPFAFPNSARNVYIATHRHWLQFVVYIRFEAPPADCESLAQKLLPSVTPLPIGAAEAQAFSRPVNPGGAFGDLSWLDLQNITRGQSYQDRDPQNPRVIVDSERGIFYYIQTD